MSKTSNKPLTWEQRVAEARKQQGTNKDYAFAERLASVGNDETRYRAARTKDIEMAQNGWFAVTGEGAPLGSRTQVTDVSYSSSSNTPASGHTTNTGQFSRMYYQMPEKKPAAATAPVAAQKKPAAAAAPATPEFDFNKYATPMKEQKASTSNGLSFLSKYLGSGYQSTQIDSTPGLYQSYLERKANERSQASGSGTQQQPSTFMGRFVQGLNDSSQGGGQASRDWGAAGSPAPQSSATTTGDATPGHMSYDSSFKARDEYERRRQERAGRFAGSGSFRQQLGASLASPLTA